MIELVAANEQQVHDAALLLGRRLGNGNWIRDGVKSGIYTAQILKCDGVEKFFILWSVNNQRTLIVNAAVALGKGIDEFKLLVQAALHIAKTNACVAMECVTARAGLAEKLIENGFNATGVCLTRPV